MSKPQVDFFSAEAAQKYDERNVKLSSISGCMHFLAGLVLKELPKNARLLCVGAGTGAEIIFLAKVFPHWRFVALEPSLSMLNVCKARTEAAGILDRCDFVHGYVQDLPPQAEYDAVLSFLVAHFVKREDRSGFLSQMVAHLRVGGIFITTEISFDLNSTEFPSMLQKWGSVQEMMGATPESLANLPNQIKDMLTVISPAETESLIRQAGIEIPIRFFQAFMICGWYGKK
ncbi:MAG: class I SAM-dependent methyltransferase [Bacteriovoracia bacterium]